MTGALLIRGTVVGLLLGVPIGAVEVLEKKYLNRCVGILLTYPHSFYSCGGNGPRSGFLWRSVSFRFSICAKNIMDRYLQKDGSISRSQRADASCLESMI